MLEGVSPTNCKICHQSLKTVTIDDQKWLACRNPWCESYGQGIERVRERSAGPQPARKQPKRRSYDKPQEF